MVRDVSTSWCSAVSLGFDYGAWCRMTACRLSCTAALILSINNNPPHSCPEPHLLITICHLSNASTSPSPIFSPLPVLFPFFFFSFFSLLSSSLPTGPVIPCTSPPPPLLPPTLNTGPLAFRAQRHGPAYRDVLALHTHTLTPLTLNCTMREVWLIRSSSTALIGKNNS